MLRSIPKGLFSWDCRLVDDGVEVALLDLSTLRDAAKFELEGRRWEIRREGMLTGDWLLETGGQVIARATKISAFRRSYEIVADNRRLELAPVGFARRAYRLRHGDIVIGGMAPDGLFRRSADVDFPEELQLATRIFLAFLVLVQWRRTARSKNG
jgi:hypothetical protein